MAGLNRQREGNMLFAEALDINMSIAEGKLLEILTERGIDPFASDKANAEIRRDYGDTPYCAPDVVPALGHCGEGGGDAWPVCCEGHKFMELVSEVIYDHERGLRDGPTGERCHWLVERASGNPEPDSYSDTVVIGDCAAPLTRFVSKSGSRGWSCEAGHDGWEFGSPECEAQMLDEEWNDRQNGG
jgi:hypothetical protein